MGTDPHGFLAVLDLRLFVLAAHHGVGGNVPDEDGGYVAFTDCPPGLDKHAGPSAPLSSQHDIMKTCSKRR